MRCCSVEKFKRYMKKIQLFTLVAKSVKNRAKNIRTGEKNKMRYMKHHEPRLEEIPHLVHSRKTGRSDGLGRRRLAFRRSREDGPLECQGIRVAHHLALFFAYTQPNKSQESEIWGKRFLRVFSMVAGSFLRAGGFTLQYR